MWRSATIQSRSSSGSAARAAAAPARGDARVDAFDAVRERREALRRRRPRAPPRRGARGTRRPRSAAPPRRRRARAARRGPAARRPRRRRPAPRARRAASPSSAGTKTAASRKISARAARRRARCARAPGRAARAAAAAATVERPRAQEHELPVGLRGELARERAQERPLRSAATRATTILRFARGREPLEVDAERDELVPAREAQRRPPRAVSVARREQRVEPAEQPLALRSAPAGRRAARREKNVATVSASASRSARYERLGRPGSKPCTTSKRPAASATARFARTPTGTPMRLRREIGTAGPSATNSAVEPGRERAAAGGEVAGAVRRREHGRPVAARAELPREPGDVLVHVVRLRPGEGGDEGDPKCHRSGRV